MRSTRWISTPAIVALFWLGSQADALAQRGAVGGEVVDEDGNPMEGVEVTLELADGGGRKTTTKTDKDGRFIKPGLKLGAYRVELRYEGYQPEVLGVQVGSGQNFVDRVTMYKLPPGVLSDTEHAKATELLAAANAGSESGDPQATIDALKEFLEMVPDSAEAHFNIAQSYQQLKDPDNALIYFEKTAELKPSFFEAWLNMSYIYTERKEWDKGIEVLQKAIELKPTEVVPNFNLAVLAINAQKMELAEEALNKVVQLDPGRAMAHYHLGTVSLNKGDNEAAATHFNKYLELDPEGANAAAAKAILETLSQ